MSNSGDDNAEKGSGCGSCCHSCGDSECGAGKAGCKGPTPIGETLIVLSGKGGVGKSTVALNLAVALSLEGYRVGLMDIDIHGPSIPVMLGLAGSGTVAVDGLIEPLTFGNLKVMSIGFLLQDRDDALIWRGPMKAGVIDQFLKEVNWGPLDYLVVDSPPGTGDEPLSICQACAGNSRAVIVTTPQEVASADVRKSMNFCRKLDLPVAGIVENMSGFVCPDCGKVTHIFSRGGGAAIAEKWNVPLLGEIPLEPAIGECGDNGKPYVHRFSDSAVAQLFREICSTLTENTKSARAE